MILVGSTIELCSTATAPLNTVGNRCPTVAFSLTSASPSATLYGDITPVEPYRLRVVATGYGPNGARKQLEGMIRNDLLDGLSAAAATTMIGPYTPPFRYEPGTCTGITYSGGNCNVPPGCVPSFALTNTGALNYVTNNPPGPSGGNPAQAQPPPTLLDSNNNPDWQMTPAALEQLVNDSRQSAMLNSRYFVNPTGNQANFNVGSNSNPPGSFANGT